LRNDFAIQYFFNIVWEPYVTSLQQHFTRHPFNVRVSRLANYGNNTEHTLTTNAYFEPQPIVGFSHLSRVSNSIRHNLVFCMPDCIAFLAGRYTLTLRETTCSSGTPVRFAASWQKKYFVYSAAPTKLSKLRNEPAIFHGRKTTCIRSSKKIMQQHG